MGGGYADCFPKLLPSLELATFKKALKRVETAFNVPKNVLPFTRSESPAVRCQMPNFIVQQIDLILRKQWIISPSVRLYWRGVESADSARL